MHTQTTSTAPASTIAWRWEQYKLGIDFYRAGEPAMRCASAEQLRGWYDSNRAEAEANIPGFAQKVGW